MAEAISFRSDAVRDGAGCENLTPLFAAVSVATSGDNTLVAGVTAKRIRLIAAVFVAASAVTLALQSGAAGTALTGVMSLITGVPLVLAWEPHGHVQTALSDLLNASLSGNVQVSGVLVYCTPRQ